MTWNELNERTGMIEDNYYAWEEMHELELENEPIFKCQLLDGIIESLQQLDYPTDGFGRVSDYHAEYIETETLIKTLENVR